MKLMEVTQLDSVLYRNFISGQNINLLISVIKKTGISETASMDEAALINVLRNIASTIINSNGYSSITLLQLNKVVLSQIKKLSYSTNLGESEQVRETYIQSRERAFEEELEKHRRDFDEHVKDNKPPEVDFSDKQQEVSNTVDSYEQAIKSRQLEQLISTLQNIESKLEHLDKRISDLESTVNKDSN